MTGYLEVLTDPSYAGQAVVMTYPLVVITVFVKKSGVRKSMAGWLYCQRII